MEQPRQRSNEKFGSTTCFSYSKTVRSCTARLRPVLLKAVAVKHFILESVNTPPKINLYRFDRRWEPYSGSGCGCSK
jgi:hypothetical protein